MLEVAQDRERPLRKLPRQDVRGNEAALSAALAQFAELPTRDDLSSGVRARRNGARLSDDTEGACARRRPGRVVRARQFAAICKFGLSRTLYGGGGQDPDVGARGAELFRHHGFSGSAFGVRGVAVQALGGAHAQSPGADAGAAAEVVACRGRAGLRVCAAVAPREFGRPALSVRSDLIARPSRAG